MERTTSITEAKEIMGANFIGPIELNNIADKLSIKVPTNIPNIYFGLDELKNKKRDYILILASSQMKDGEPLTLLTLRDHFGINPDISEPCFYNQDWYLKEEFASNCNIEQKWYLIRKELIDTTRGMDAETQSEVNNNSLPSAAVCAYVFFAYFYFSSQYLWQNDFVWCCDLDSNGDRIYVARYFDSTGGSKNGFSIHRHLRLRDCFGCIDSF